jgi:hypothetical protein
MLALPYKKEIAIGRPEQSDEDRLPANENPGQIEQAIHGLLIYREEQRPWSIHEIELELGSSLAVEDSLRRLQGVGLLHRCGEFVWASRAALAADEIAL